MGKPQLFYGAYDTGPSNYGLDIISYAQRKLNWSVKYVGNNPSYVDVFGMNFDYAIVGGPSSFENVLDAAMLTASVVKKKPVYVLGHSPRSILRPGVKKYVGQATAIVALPSDIELAKAFGYKDAVWLGYPSHWGIDPVKLSISDALNQDDYSPQILRIFVCGLRHAGITDHMLASVIRSILDRGCDSCIYFQAHPSEIETTQDKDKRKWLLSHARVHEIKTRDNVASIMLAADCTVCSGGATAVLEGALLRLPVVYYLDDQVKAYVKSATNEEIWGPVAAGACEIATADSMPSVLNALLSDADDEQHTACATLYEKQVAAFPDQPLGMNTIKEVLDYIQNPAGYVPFDKRPSK